MSKAGRTGPGTHWLKSTLVQRAWRLSGERLKTQWQVLAKKAAVGTAHTIVQLIYYTLSTHSRDVEYGAAFGARSAQTRAQKLGKELERFGYTVTKAA